METLSKAMQEVFTSDSLLITAENANTYLTNFLARFHEKSLFLRFVN